MAKAPVTKLPVAKKYLFTVFRNPNTIRIRKWCVEMWFVDDLGRQVVCDRRYMFGFGDIVKRLERKILRMRDRRKRVDGVLNLYNS